MLRLKIILMVALATAVIQLVWIGYGIHDMRSAELARAKQEQAYGLNTAASILALSVPGMAVSFGDNGDLRSVTASNIPDVADHGAIDQVNRATGDQATLFSYDSETREFLRRTTTLIDVEGKRAVGTALDTSSDAYAALSRGEAFHGEATLFGVDYLSIYVPITNAENEVVGALFVANAISYINQLIRDHAIVLIVEGLIAIVATIAVVWVLLTFLLRGLSRIERAIDALAQGQREMTVPEQHRKDEVGLIARNLEALRQNLTTAEDDQRRALEEEAQARASMSAMLGELDREVSGVVAAVGEGDLSRAITARFDQPELQSLSGAVNNLRDRIQAFVGDIAETLRAMASGDLTRGMPRIYSGAFGQIADDANNTLERLGGVLGEVRSAVGENRSVVGAIEKASGDLGARVEEQAAALQQTAATMEQMAASVRSNATSLSEAEAAARNARETTEAGGNAASAAVDAVGRIAESSGQIAEILKVIDSIAFQTNLLALNAAVEAARAGDAGKGFAVVANEVGNLARQSSEAAREIGALVIRNQGSVEEGVQMVRNAGSALEKINDEISRLSDRVTAVSLAGREQSTGIEEVNRAVSGLDQMTQENATLSERTAAQVSILNRQTQRLSESVGALRLPAAAPAADRWVA